MTEPQQAIPIRDQTRQRPERVRRDIDQFVNYLLAPIYEMGIGR